MIKKSHKCCSILCMASIFFYILISASLCFGASEAKGIEFDKDDGEYSIEVELEGGSGKASVTSPTLITVKNKAATARIQWSSSNYDYMIVDGTKYLPSSTEGGSVFEIPVSAFDEPVSVIGDTVAMSKPHEIEYTLTFRSDTLQSVE